MIFELKRSSETIGILQIISQKIKSKPRKKEFISIVRKENTDSLKSKKVTFMGEQVQEVYLMLGLPFLEHSVQKHLVYIQIQSHSRL